MIDLIATATPWLLGLVGASGVGLVASTFIFPGLLPAVLSWLMGSALGRKVALGLVLVLGALFVVWRIYSAGRAAEKARQAEASLQNIRNRMRIDDDIDKLSRDERRKRLEEWARD